MQRNGARYKPEEQPDPQQAIEQKKKELDEEFQRFLKKNSQASTMSTKENRHSVPGVGFKSLLDEVVRDNGHKSQKEAALALKQQQSVVSAQNPGRSTFASTFNQGFRATNVSSFRETARLTNGFNAAANEKSNYISVGLMKDSEYADIQKEAIEHNLHNVSEEQELTNCYQETLMYMLQCIADDTALIRKRTLELQKEERVLGKQSDQCEALNHSAHFMNISITSKFQIVKNKSKQNQKELEKVVDEAEENLEKERTRVARMKAELAEAIQQSDSLKLAKEQLDRELEKVDRENKNLQRIVDFKVGEYRKEMLQLMDVDAMVSHFLASKSQAKKPAKLTQREFESKYAEGFDKLVAQLQSYVSQGQQELKNRENSQKLQIENLIAKRKQLKRLQNDLQEMRAIDREALERAARQKADKSDDSGDTEQPEEPEAAAEREEKPGSAAFDRMKNLIAGHAHIEEKVVGLVRRAQKFVVGSADSVSRIQKEHRGRGVFGVRGFRELFDIAQECEQLVTANQSRVNLGDFLLHDPTTLYQQFGKDSIIKESELSVEDKLLLEVTLENDKVMNLCLTPGEFLSSLDTCRHKGIGVDDFLCSMKVLAHRNLLAQFEAVMLKGMQLVAAMEEEVEAPGAAAGLPRDRHRATGSVGRIRTQEADGYSDDGREPQSLSRAAGRDFGLSDGTLNGEGRSTPSRRYEEEGRDRSQEQQSRTQSRINIKSKESSLYIKPHPQPVTENEEFYRIDEEKAEKDSYDELESRAAFQFSKTGGLRLPPRVPPETRKVATGGQRVRSKERRIDSGLETAKVGRPQTNQAPTQTGPTARNAAYRIKRSSKSSNTTRGPKSHPPSSTGLPKVSPYAQPVMNIEERRRKLLKLVHS